MRRKQLAIGLTMLLGIVALTSTGPRAAAQTESTLYSFKDNGIDGSRPHTTVVRDAAGNVYGTTAQGGKYQGGVVYELSYGSWTETILHTFAGGQPEANLLIDAAGNLYGTTLEAGSFGGGIVFELSPKSGGGWTYTRLHSFGNGLDGKVPFGALVIDTAGNLYGTTMQGGAFGYGVVYELSPGAGTFWTEKILHHFNQNVQDGSEPTAGLVFDAFGNLYGTTFVGGLYAAGVVFKLAPTKSGWAYKILHEFGSGSDGQYPQAGLLVDAAGNLYGTTQSGGAFAEGIVFELLPTGAGGWLRKTLHSFSGNGHDGYQPTSGVVQDAAGNLYGETENGGQLNLGCVFELSPATVGPWPEKIVYSFSWFTVAGSGGVNPKGGLVFDSSGNLYGTTQQGGEFNAGTVFEITP
jgi:uncharacterized repeat protein (TIGR03803 family)